MIPITGKYQHSCDDMMREHLPVILPPLLDIYHQDLLEPKCVLYQCVPFLQTSNLTVGPVRPEFLEIEPVIRSGQDVLVKSVYCLVSHKL